MPAGQRLGPAVTEFVEEGEQPLVAGQCGCCIVAGEPGQGDLPGAVGAQGRIPGTGDGGIDGHARSELVVLGTLARHSQVDGSVEGFGGQDSADSADGLKRR